MRRLALVAGLGLLAACGPQKVVVDPAIAARATLAHADANLRAGCFDCLVEALTQYESVRAVPVVGGLATAGALRASALLALRERELGTTDDGYLEHARELLSAVPELREDVAPSLDIIDAMPWRVGAGRSGQVDSRFTTIYVNREERLQALRTNAARDEFSAYMFVAYACESGAGLLAGNGDMKAAVGAMADAPVVAYRLAICPTSGLGALDEVVAREPRYKEAAFYDGLRATSARKLDDADAKYRSAYAWRKTWPAVTLAIANVAMSAEEFETSRDFYNETLALAPRYPDALLGKVRALTYLNKPEEAMAVADELLAINRYPGDARYWRAYNEMALDRNDPAWDDIEAADKLLINSDVPKLAGIIAINRKQYDVARGKLETSQGRNGADCQTGYYLHLVLTELRIWERAVGVARGTSSCLDNEITATRGEIDRIQAGDQPDARKARMIAGREQRIATDARMMASCAYNAAVSSYNLSKKDDARGFAETIADDEQFGERARQLLRLIR